MKRPPVFMRLEVQGEKRGIRLWLPLFLLFPLVIVMLIILSPLILLLLIGILIFWPNGWGKRVLLIFRAAFNIFLSLRGLKIDIKNGPKTIYISIV